MPLCFYSSYFIYLHHRRQQPCHALPQAGEERGVELLLRQVVEEDAGGDIILEHRSETPCNRGIIEEDVRLEVVLETAEVNIRRTTGDHCIIHHEHLAVQVASIISRR